MGKQQVKGPIKAASGKAGKGKQIVNEIKLQVNAGQANPSPPIGPALGQAGVNIMEFCKAFNAKTQAQVGTVLPVVITVYSDRSFTFVIKSPPASFLIKKYAKIDKGSSEPNRAKVGVLSMGDLIEIAKIKMEDLSATSVDVATKIIAGSARSMGVRTPYHS